ncbi:hypothetical protein VNI00_012331 [Paramarasmius palmivorus]|uniref:Sulfatase N-terminal domain-containing protein n=1 Tax=Paramarasmius palmivorus TaxID=297713 RepID=A0AAW0C8J4_9AGAR
MLAWTLLPILLLNYALQARGQGDTISSRQTSTPKPNIILILTDDQDVRTGTLDYMPKTRQAIAEQGTSYQRFYAPVSLCCPSRVSLLRAQYAHNHNITFVDGPYGGYHLFCEKGLNDAYLPIFLQEAGYNTYYAGKLMNGLDWDLVTTAYPKGWTYSDFLVDPNAYLYFNASFSANGTSDTPVSFEGQYQVDVIKDKALGLFQEALADSAGGKPFFLGIAPTAPHMEVQFDGSFTEPLPRSRDANLFEDVQVPRAPSFNVQSQGAVSWLKELDELNSTVVDYIDQVYRQRLRVLQPVDELVEAVVQAVESAGPEVADNTTSDNGYALGSHRRNPSKSLPYEEDVLVPLLIRGPTIAKNAVNTEDVYTMKDLGASILGLAGANVDEYALDGRMFLSSENTDQPRHALAEFWNPGFEEGPYAEVISLRLLKTAYRSVHVENWMYGVWCTGESELYDMTADPYQLTNLVPGNTQDDITRLLDRLNALLIVLKTCVGVVCTDPWGEIFGSSSESVSTLEQALDEKYDAYFAGLQRFGYQGCRIGYFEDGQAEFPKWEAGMRYSD